MSSKPPLSPAVSELLTRAGFPSHWLARVFLLLADVQTCDEATTSIPFGFASEQPSASESGTAASAAGVVVLDAQEFNRVDACWLVKHEYVGLPTADARDARPFLADDDNAAGAWYVDSQIVQALHHTDTSPTLAFVPIYVAAGLGYTLLWRTEPQRQLKHHEPVTVDWLPEMLVKRNTVQRSARLAILSNCGVICFANAAERDIHEQVLQTYSTQALPGTEPVDSDNAPPKRRDPQSQDIRKRQQVVTNLVKSISPVDLKLYVDVELLAPDVFSSSSSSSSADDEDTAVSSRLRYVRCKNAMESQVAYTISHIRDFAALPAKILAVNQFPYEACMIRKDLLPQTVRRGCRGRRLTCASSTTGDAASDARTSESESDLPSWWLPCFDLTTELPQFYAFLQRQQSNGATDRSSDNENASDVSTAMTRCNITQDDVPDTGLWAVKLAQGARSAGVVVAPTLARIVQCMAAPGGDRVVQRYASVPVLLDGKKFDMRTYVMVHSFEPKLIAYMYTNYYARVSGADFSLAQDSLNKYEVHLTVGKYHRDKEAGLAHCMLSRAEVLERLGNGDAGAASGAEGGEESAGTHCSAQEWEQVVEPQVLTMLRHLLEGAAPQIGEWPRSRGMYGVDWICERSTAGELVPRLIEVNFAPDVSTIAGLDSSFAQRALRVLFGEESLRLDGSLDSSGIARMLGVVPIHEA